MHAGFAEEHVERMLGVIDEAAGGAEEVLGGVLRERPVGVEEGEVAGWVTVEAVSEKLIANRPRRHERRSFERSTADEVMRSVRL